MTTLGLSKLSLSVLHIFNDILWRRWSMMMMATTTMMMILYLLLFYANSDDNESIFAIVIITAVFINKKLFLF